ncbi:hypothetical protein ACN6LA_005811, partial [Streptomyces sp. SAS_269]
SPYPLLGLALLAGAALTVAQPVPSASLADIAAMSDGWGCCASATGSVIIWFSQRARTGERVPLVPTAPAPSLTEGLQVPRELRVAALAASATAADGVLAGAR